MDFLGAAWPHGKSWPLFALSFAVAMTAMRILLVWLYSNTTSVWPTQLLHASSTASLVVLGPLHVTPAQEALWYGCYAASLWVVVAVVITLYSKHLVRQPLQAAASH